MANTSALYARLDTDLIHDAEGILGRLGVSRASALQMFYKQIVLHNGLPFDIRLSEEKPVAAGGLSREELDMELAKGIASMKKSSCLSVDDVDVAFAREFAI